MTAGVFISRPAALSPAQRDLYERWCGALSTWRLELHTLERSDYTDDPWTVLADRISMVHGIVAFGFRGVSGHASPWMQIEAGMAIANGLCVLALPERGVHDGVFDETTWGAHVVGRQLCDRVDDGLVAEFVTMVRRGVRRHARRPA
jgi:hypothetical protein